MKHEVICQGATVEGAKQEAFHKLSAPTGAKVEYEILEQPKAKIFGIFGGSLAKVKAFYLDRDDSTEAEDVLSSVKAEIKNIISDDDKFAEIKSYINAVLAGFEIEADIEIGEDEEGLDIHILCDDKDARLLIGRKGETLDSIQYLVRLALSKTNKEYKHSVLNVGSYREKRRESLIALAEKNARKVKKYGRNAVLDPMTPYERRIIHTTIQEIEGVDSHSVGKDDNRKVVITLAEGYEPEVPYSQSGYNKGGYRGGNRGGRGGYNKGGYNKNKQKYVPDAPKRAPKSDFDTAFSYGKVDF